MNKKRAKFRKTGLPSTFEAHIDFADPKSSNADSLAADGDIECQCLVGGRVGLRAVHETSGRIQKSSREVLEGKQRKR